MKIPNNAVAIAWFAAIVGVAWAGAWSITDGGGWLILLVFFMVAATKINTNDLDIT